MVRRSSGSERGNAAWTVVTILVLLGFGALAIDIGHARMVRAQLQNAIDAGVHAGLLELDGSDEGVDMALEAAAAVANLNVVNGGSPGLSADDFEAGSWDGTTFDTSADASDVNALRVSASADVQALFAVSAFGVSELAAGARSAAAREVGGPAAGGDCYLPMAIPDCWFDSYTDDQLLDVTFLFSPATSDSIGWARPTEDGSNPSASWVNGMLTDLYDGDDDCSGGEVEIGDEIRLGSGVQNSNLTTVAAIFADSDQYWDGAMGERPSQASNSIVSSGDYEDGKVVAGPIMVFDGGSSYSCPGPGSSANPTGAFNDHMIVTGFVYAVIYDVTNGSAAQKNLKVRLDMASYNEWGTSTDPDAPDYGVIVADGPPRLVY